jgi:hypothetical protein
MTGVGQGSVQLFNGEQILHLLFIGALYDLVNVSKTQFIFLFYLFHRLSLQMESSQNSY